MHSYWLHVALMNRTGLQVSLKGWEETMWGLSLRSTRIGVRVITTLRKGWKQIGWNFFCYAVNIQLMSFILYYAFKQKLSTSFYIILHRQCCFSFVFDDMCQGNVSTSCIVFCLIKSRQTNTDARYLTLKL